MRHFIGVAFVVALLLPPSAVRGGEPPVTEPSAEIIFRVTLSGPVPSDDAFGVRVECSERCLTDESWLLCAPPDEIHRLAACDERTYETVTSIRPGLTVDYALLRLPDGLRNPSDSILPGSIVVREGRQTISLGYVYPGGAPATLPDTAVPHGAP